MCIRDRSNGDDDALAHAAGELVGEFVHALFRRGDADALQELDEMCIRDRVRAPDIPLTGPQEVRTTFSRRP